jgi:hypothetical protein
MAGIGYYGRDLDINDFNQHRLLWPEFGHRQLWPKAATMVGIGPTISMKPLWTIYYYYFFQQEIIEWCYLLVDETMAVRHVILTNRETHVSVKREIARALDEKM